MSSPHVLVTGGAGFIGSHLVDALLARDCEVTVLDALLPQVHADAEVDADGWPLYLNPKARRLRGNILQDGVFEGALQGATHLVHLAASVGVGQSMTDIVDYTRNNALSAAVMLEALTRGGHRVRRMAVASSMSIYGEGLYRDTAGRPAAPPLRSRAQLEAKSWELADEAGPLTPVPTPEDKPLAPASIYAVNKRDHEEMFLAVGRALDIPTVALRLFNAYGSRQALSNPYTGVAAIFISRLLNDRPPLVFEDGRQRRDFVHVQDVADAFVTTLIEDEAPVWDAFNVGSGRPIAIMDMAEVLSARLGKSIEPERLDCYRVGDIRHCFASVDKLRDRFGIAPRRSFESGMDELIDWVARAPAPVDRAAESMQALKAARLVV